MVDKSAASSISYDAETNLSDIKHFVAFSKHLQSECSRLRLAYLEVSDREQAAEDGMRHLLSIPYLS